MASYFSGITDENDHLWLGGYPGALVLSLLIGILAPRLVVLAHGSDTRVPTTLTRRGVTTAMTRTS